MSKRIVTISFDISRLEDVVKLIMGLQLDQLTMGELEILDNTLGIKRIDVDKEIRNRQTIGMHVNKEY